MYKRIYDTFKNYNLRNFKKALTEHILFNFVVVLTAINCFSSMHITEISSQ